MSMVSSLVRSSTYSRTRNRHRAPDTRQLGLAMRDINRRAGDDRGADPGPAVADLAEKQIADQRGIGQPHEFIGGAGARIGRQISARHREMRQGADDSETHERTEALQIRPLPDKERR